MRSIYQAKKFAVLFDSLVCVLRKNWYSQDIGTFKAITEIFYYYEKQHLLPKYQSFGG